MTSTSMTTFEPMPSATTDDELNKLLDQIEEEISKDMDLTQDLLDILEDETREQEEEPCYEEPMDEEVGWLVRYLHSCGGGLVISTEQGCPGFNSYNFNLFLENQPF